MTGLERFLSGRRRVVAMTTTAVASHIDGARVRSAARGDPRLRLTRGRGGSGSPKRSARLHRRRKRPPALCTGARGRDCDSVSLPSDAVDFQPVASPDGTRVAFVSSRDGNDEIYVANTDGSGVVRADTDTECGRAAAGLVARLATHRVRERSDRRQRALRRRRRRTRADPPDVPAGRRRRKPVVVARRGADRLRLGSRRRLGRLRDERRRNRNDRADGQRRRRRFPDLVTGRITDRVHLRSRPPGRRRDLRDERRRARMSSS